MSKRRIVAGLALAGIVLGGCSGEVPGSDGPPALPTPVVSALSTTSVAVGDEVRFIGSGFAGPDVGWTEVTFRGVYETEAGNEDVNFTTGAEYVSEGELRWSRFGPYQVPFSRAGNQVGVFRGQVFATNRDANREQRQPDDTVQQLDVQVLPSLVVRQVQAFGEGWESSCRHLGTRLVNFVPYRMTVEAVGFEAESFTYTISEGLIEGTGVATQPVTVRHEGSPRRIDTLGEIEELRFAQVPFGVPTYRASVAVDAQTAQGEHYQQFLMLTVHEPVWVRYEGGVQVAEIMEPTPVSGCIPGGVNGRDVSYTETTSETRTISSTQSWTSNWTKAYTEEHSESYGEGGAEANKIGFSSADQSNWNWNVHGDVMVGGEAGVPLVSKGKVELRVGGGRDWGGSHTDTRLGEQSWTHTTSYTEAVSTTEQEMESLGEGFTETWSVSSSTSESLNFRTFLLPNHFGVFYRQTTRLVRAGEILAMDLCGNDTVVGEIELNDYTWAPDIAMGSECPPFPESQLPEPQCLLPPCDGTY